jgi:putative nucleotidyltransferase with HDIG domain
MKFFAKLFSEKKVRRTLRNEPVVARNEKEIWRRKLWHCTSLWGLLWALSTILCILPLFYEKETLQKAMNLNGFLIFPVAIGLIIAIVVVMWRIIRRKKDIAPSITLLFITATILNILLIKAVLWFSMLFIARENPFNTVSPVIPFAFATFIAAMLIGENEAILAGICVSLITGLMGGMNFWLTITSLIACVIVAAMTHKIHRRTGLFRIGLISGLGAALAIAMMSTSARTMLISGVLATLAGLFTALLVLLLLPIFERLFRISSDISLLELADMEHPLLKRLSEEAPGTYHHSILTANLAQAAINAIGGNGLRTAICAYFHDIGKLAKPEFFVENTHTGINPHDELTPNMSALVIISHVKEGVDLALQYKLPLQVIEAIEQHHGTSMVHFFYHKALQLNKTEKREQSNTIENVKEETFRYPGPKPSSKENAIILLADSIEAASRTLEKITPANIEDLVHNVIAKKIDDGQLDSSDLTFAEITKIKRTFIFTLSNMLHTRIPYPPLNANNNLQPANSDKN